MSFEPTSGYSTTRTSTVFTDGENQQRAEVVASLNGDWVLESYSTDKSSAVVTDGVNKQRAVVTYNLNGGSGGSGGGASGNYLPLSGGTLTGDISFGGTTAWYNKIGFWDTASTKVIVFCAANTDLNVARRPYGIAFDFQSNSGMYPLYDDMYPLGKSGSRWKNIYTMKLNNGADLAVPTEGGTLARIEDIDEVVGNISILLDAINGESI